MSDEPKKGIGRWIWRPFLAMLALLVLYMLSIGPVSRWTDPDPSKHEIESQVYAPLWWLGQRSDYLAETLLWYRSKWIVDASGEDGG